MRKVIIAVMLFAAVCMANQMQRDMLLFSRLSSRKTDAAPTDYWHYWHPSKFADGLDRGNATTPLHATNITGTVTISDQGWTFGTANSPHNITLPGSISNTTNYSLSLWIANPKGGSNGGWILSDRGRQNYPTYSGDFLNDFQFLVNTAGSEAFMSGFNPGNNAASIDLSTSMPSTNWTHYAAVWAVSNMYLYVNGTLATNRTFTGELAEQAQPTPSRIGGPSWVTATSNGARDFGYRGDLDKMQFWQRVLSPEEVEALYNQGREN